MNSDFEHGIQVPLKLTSPLFILIPFRTLILHLCDIIYYSWNNQFQVFLIILSAQSEMFPPVLKSNHSFPSRVKTSLILCFRVNMLLLSAFVYFAWASILHLFSFALHCNSLVCLYIHHHWLRATYIKIYIMFHLSFYFFLFLLSETHRIFCIW